MAQQPANHSKDWSDDDVAMMRKLASENTPTPLMAYRLGRTEDAVQSKAAAEGISLKPVNRSPYGNVA